jgi:hypothetical protein
MNRRYCDTQCPIGKKKSEEFLNRYNSAYDAALDFIWFTEECFKTCPYKEQHESNNKK